MSYNNKTKTILVTKIAYNLIQFIHINTRTELFCLLQPAGWYFKIFNGKKSTVITHKPSFPIMIIKQQRKTKVEKKSVAYGKIILIVGVGVPEP